MSRAIRTEIRDRLRDLALPSFGHWTEFLPEISAHNATIERHPFPALQGVGAALTQRRDASSSPVP